MFLPSQTWEINSNFSSSSSAKISSFWVQADKNTRSAFWLNRFLFVDMQVFRVRQNNRLLSSLSSNLQPWFKVWLCCFLPWVHKISHWCIIFYTGSQRRRYGRARGAISPLTTACAPPFQFAQNAFLENHATTRQQAIIEKGIILLKHNSRLKFSRLFAKLLATNCFTCDPIIRLINILLRMYACRSVTVFR